MAHIWPWMTALTQVSCGWLKSARGPAYMVLICSSFMANIALEWQCSFRLSMSASTQPQVHLIWARCQVCCGPNLKLNKFTIRSPYMGPMCMLWAKLGPEELTKASPLMGQMPGILWARWFPDQGKTIRSSYMGLPCCGPGLGQIVARGINHSFTLNGPDVRHLMGQMCSRSGPYHMFTRHGPHLWHVVGKVWAK